MSEAVHKRYLVNIKLKSPLHINSGDDRGGYRAVMLNSGGAPFIPASTIKGKLRHNFAGLIGEGCRIPKIGSESCGCPVCNLFGGAGYQPSRIYIPDFLLTNDKTSGQTDDSKNGLRIRTGTAVDRYRRVVKDQALFRTQVVEQSVFSGEIEIFFTGETIIHEPNIRLGLKMIETIGGGKSRGWGFVAVEVTGLE